MKTGKIIGTILATPFVIVTYLFVLFLGLSFALFRWLGWMDEN